MKWVIASLFLMFATAAAGSSSAQTPLTVERVERLESALDLDAALNSGKSRYGPQTPPRAIEWYARHYRLTEISGHAVIEAVYAPPVERYVCENCHVYRYQNGVLVQTDEPIPQPSEEQMRRGSRGIHIDGTFPAISDGGCDIISLWFDAETLALVGIECNGLA